MRYVTIRKVDNWSVDSIASTDVDRVIGFKEGELFAVVCSLFYGNVVTKHRTLEAVLKASAKRNKDGYPMHLVLGADGTMYRAMDNRLVPVGR